MSDFDEDEFDAMTDEALADYLTHDAELPLSFARGAGAVLSAAAALAARQRETLPEPESALEAFRADYLPIVYYGKTIYDGPRQHRRRGFSVCGCVGEYIRKGPWRSLVFSDAEGRNVYYLDAENVSDAEMQKMIASIR